MGHKFLALLAGSLIFASLPASSNYKLQNYSVNSGATNSSASTTYKLQGTTGEISGAASSSATYSTKSSSIKAEQASVPPAPTLSNGSGTYYNKLNFIINTTGNPTDATYSVAVSTTSNFLVTNYVQTDGTLGSGQNYQTYSFWGSGSGSLVTGLSPGTTYYFKVSASNGKFSASAYGPSANVATVSPSLTFSVSPNSVSLGNLTAGSVISSGSLSFTFTTNSASGGTIYMNGDSTGLNSTQTGHVITVTPPSGDLSSLSEGYGFQAQSASSPLTIQSPYGGGSNVVGAIYTTFTPVFSSTSLLSSGTASAKVMAKAAATTPSASDYASLLTFVAASSY